MLVVRGSVKDKSNSAYNNFSEEREITPVKRDITPVRREINPVRQANTKDVLYSSSGNLTLRSYS
jgi:hypothetical protein